MRHGQVQGDDRFTNASEATTWDLIVDSPKGGQMDRKSLLAAFRIAIDKENEAFEFYADIAKKTDDPEVQKLFQHFANDEFAHSEALKEMYSSLRDKARPEGGAG